jgi:hypothetical protein
MKSKSFVLYASVALNAALLVLLAWPRGNDLNLALAQSVSTNVGNLSAAVARGGGEQDAVWIADRVSGRMVIYQYELGETVDPIRLVGGVDLREGLDERQIGQLMLLPSAFSSSRATVYVIDTDSERAAIYYYDRSKGVVEGVQRIDLRQDLGKSLPAAGAGAAGAPAPGI